MLEPITCPQKKRHLWFSKYHHGSIATYGQPRRNTRTLVVNKNIVFWVIFSDNFFLNVFIFYVNLLQEYQGL